MVQVQPHATPAPVRGRRPVVRKRRCCHAVIPNTARNVVSPVFIGDAYMVAAAGLGPQDKFVVVVDHEVELV